MATIKVGKFFVEMAYKSDQQSLNNLTKDTSKALSKAHKENQGFMAKSMKAFAGKLGGLAKGGLLAGGGGLIAGGFAFVNSMKEASDIADDILTTSQQIGISPEMVQKLQFSGIQADIGKQGYLDFIKKTSKVVGAVRSGKATKEEKKVARSFGIKKNMDLEAVFMQMVKKSGQMPREKFAYFLSKFQIRAKDALALATALPEFDKQFEKAQSMGAKIQSKENIEMGEEVSAKIETRELTNKLDMLTTSNIRALDGIQDSLQKGTEAMISGFNFMTENLPKLIAEIKQIPIVGRYIGQALDKIGLKGSGR